MRNVTLIFSVYLNHAQSFGEKKNYGVAIQSDCAETFQADEKYGVFGAYTQTHTQTHTIR